MVQLESSAPLLTSRVHQGAATSISHNANTYDASLQEAPEPERPSCKDRKPWRRRWSHFAHSFIKLATGIKAGYKRSTHAIRRSWKKSWTVETFSFIFSVLTLAGLVATLSTHQGKPLPKWPQLITINSVLSLFSLIMRTGVSVVLAEGISQSRWKWYRKTRTLGDIKHFDAASRGPWGSFLLLCHMRPRRAYYMASLGALATVMTALTGFFSQQLLLFEDCAQRTDTAIVRLARTNNYTAAGGILGPGTGGNWMLWAEYAPMVAATTVGLIQPIEDFTNVFARGCDSGNCTFPSSDGASFSTVAISHICEDISGLIRQYTNYSHTSTVLTTPEGAPTRLNYSDHRNYSDFSVMTTSTHATKYRGHDLFPLHTITLLFRERFASNDSRAVNCTLFPTVNTYSVKVANTRLEETLLESIPLDFDYPDITTNLAGGEEEGLEWRPNLFALATDYTMRDGIKEPCAGSADPAPELVKHYKVKTEEWDEEGKIHRTSTQWYCPKDCLWTMSQPAAWGLRRHFDTMFHEQILKSNGLSLIEGNAYLRALWRQDPEGRENMTGPPIKGQTSIASIDESFRNMTRAMTAFIRTHGAEGEEGWARGYMWANTTCVYVRWEWIAFPVVMIALTGLFLLLVIIDNWKVESDRLWKSSVLATLFCEVDVERDRPKGKEEMSEIAKSTGVSLEGKSGRLRMVVRE